jgi:hypothetical protein
MTVKGLERITLLPHGREAARVIVFLSIAHFAFWYGLHLPDNQEFALAARRYDMWDSINRANPERRIEIARQIARTPGKLVVFVRYWPQHIFQDEWVYNGADIDGQRVVWARDLGDRENEKLDHYYADRKLLLLEPDFRPPRLQSYQPEPPRTNQVPPQVPKAPPTHPLIELEQVR